MESISIFLIQNAHIPRDTLVLILMLPLVSTFVSLGRYLIGLRTFGIYAPIILTYSYYLISLNNGIVDLEIGIKYGLIFTFIAFTFSFIINKISKGVRLHYISKVNLMIGLISIFTIIFLLLAGLNNSTRITQTNVIAIILIILVSENYLASSIRKGTKTTLSIGLQTVVFSLISFVFLSLPDIQTFFLNNIWIVPIILIINIFIGSFSGFRLKEYFRFQDILK